MIVFNWLGLGLLMLWVGILTVTLKLTNVRLHVLIGMLLGCTAIAAVDLILRLGLLVFIRGS